MTRLIETCLERGITTFDHAAIYGDYTTEADFGAVLAAQPHLRPKMQLISKCGIRLVTPNRPEHQLKSYDSSREHIIASTEQSLRNLRTDYLDLLLLHRPDSLMRPEEVAEAVATLKQDGKVRYFGVSNFAPAQFDLLRALTPLVTNQVAASLLHTDPVFDGTFDQCLRYGIRPLAWGPLGGGRYFTEEGTRINRVRTAVREVNERYGGPGEDVILLAWLLRHPVGAIPVLGTSKAERIEQALRALTVELSREDWYYLLEAARGQEVA